MAPLNIEVYNPARSEWINVGELKPGDRPGSMSQNKPDGTREVYLFECAQDDSHSSIYRSELGVDTEIVDARLVGTEGLEVVSELKSGDKPYILTVGTDISPQRRIVRFTHK